MITTVEALHHLIGFPTVSRDSNKKLTDWVTGVLRQHGVEPLLIENEDGTKANLFASTGPEDQPGVMLSGHTDVVPIDGQNWTKPPFTCTEDDGRLYGRGTADMKGFIASALSAFCHATTQELSTPLHLALSYDEEIGCIGVRSLIDMLDKAPVRPAFCIVGEPTHMAVAVGHKGKTALKATCIGSEAHSALAPTAVNAVHLACDLIQEIRNIQDDLRANGARDDAYDIPYTTLHAGLIEGGVALNIVPNHAEVAFEIRNLSADSPEAILERIQGAITPIIAAARKTSPAADIQINITNTYPGLETPLEAEIVSFVTGLTGTNKIIKVAFGTEGGLFQRDLGIPTLVCGPGSMEQGHKPDEFVSMDQLNACDNMLGQLILRLKEGI